jgi:hypothetical protein
MVAFLFWLTSRDVLGEYEVQFQDLRRAVTGLCERDLIAELGPPDRLKLLDVRL